MAVEQLCTVEDVVNLPWAAFATVPPARQQSLINTASQQILLHCRRPGFVQTSEDELFDGKNTSFLWLSKRPVVTISQVKVNGEIVDNADGLAWIVNSETGKLVRGSGNGDPRFNRWWPVGTRNIEVEYWAGYEVVPAPIVEATAYMARFSYESSKQIGSYQSESIGDYSYTLGSPIAGYILPPYVVSLCAPYVQDDGPL